MSDDFYHRLCNARRVVEDCRVELLKSSRISIKKEIHMLQEIYGGLL